MSECKWAEKEKEFLEDIENLKSGKMRVVGNRAMVVGSMCAVYQQIRECKKLRDEEIKEKINEVEVWKRAYDQARFVNKIKFSKQLRMERIQHLMLGFIYGITVMFFIFYMIFF